MKMKLSILAGGLLAFCLPLQTWAQKTQTQLIAEGNFGPKVKWATFNEIKITNLQGQPLGRIQEVALDLTNGRVVEVLVVYDQTLRMGGKTVAVPPSALYPDIKNKVYQIDMPQEKFVAAPLFDLSKWADSTQPEQIAAAYRYFGKQPYFMVPGEAGNTATPNSSLAKLGAVDRMDSLINMPVGNLKGEHLGNVQTLVLNVPDGIIQSVFIKGDATGSMLKFSTIIQPTELSFNAKHDALLLDDTKVEYAEEPRVVFETGTAGQETSFREQHEDGNGNAAQIPLVQGIGSQDINVTAQIYRSIKSSDLDPSEHVAVVTLLGRVTLRGTVKKQATKDGITAIALASVKDANVDNQMIIASSPEASL